MAEETKRRWRVPYLSSGCQMGIFVNGGEGQTGWPFTQAKYLTNMLSTLLYSLQSDSTKNNLNMKWNTLRKNIPEQSERNPTCPLCCSRVLYKSAISFPLPSSLITFCSSAWTPPHWQWNINQAERSIAMDLRKMWKVQIYRVEIYSLQILLSRTQAGPGSAVKEQQEEISPNHVQRLNLISVHMIPNF